MNPSPQHMFKFAASVFLALLACVVISSPALADGIIIPDPPPPTAPVTSGQGWLTIRYHRVDVSIEDQIAVTRVEQEFLNENDWEVEGTYIFPLPDGAVVSNFLIWVDGVPLDSEILPADQARKIYEDIVRERRDPALLEYIGKDAVRARIFPIPPGASRVVELEYSQVLASDQGLVRYLYPLNTEKFSASTLEECSVRVELKSPQPLRSVYSPTHQDRIEILRQGDFQAVIGYEEYDVLPDQDFELIYTVSQEDVGLNLLTYPDSSGSSLFGEEGYFLLLAAPSVEVSRVIPRDIILVLDTSGSMEGEKLDQAKEAAAYILKHLNQEDRFNVTVFSTGVKHFDYSLQPASQASRAVEWINRMQALGGTNINEALLQTLAVNSQETATTRPQVVLFLTDGLPTEGVTEIDKILANVQAAAGTGLRLFSFGVGDDVNTVLLDTLAAQNRGIVNYVRSGERIDEEVSNLFAKIQTPVLTDLELDFGDVLVEELYPPRLPDLFAGSQLLLAGRYRLPAGHSGREQIKLSGSVDSRKEVFNYQVDFRPDGKSPVQHSFIPRLWAARKIGYLLNQIRIQGENQEWIDAVIQLSLKYGIITPYTSFLMIEDEIFSGEGRDEAAQQLQEAYAGSASGAEAVDKADAESNLRSAESAPQAELDADYQGYSRGEPVLKIVGGKSFYLRDGIWIDSDYDPGMKAIQVSFGSQAYFEMLDDRPGWGQYLALGDSVIFVESGKVYQIIPGDGGVSSLPNDLPASEGGIGASTSSGQERRPPWQTFCSSPLLVVFLLGTFLKIKIG
ncbi:MAG: VIT domain-containing protein [Anaerolineales bacterium]